MPSIVRKTLFFLDARTRIQIVGLFALILVSTALEMLSIALVFPLVQLVFSPDSDLAWIGQIKSWLGAEGRSLLYISGFVFVLVFIGKNIALLSIQYVVSRFTMVKLAAFQNRLYRHYLGRPYVAQLNDHSAVVLRNLTTASSAVFDSLRALMTIALEGILVLAAVLTTALFVPGLALAGIAALLILAAGFHYLAGPYFRRWGDQANAANASLFRWAVQGIAALKDIKAIGCARYFETRFEDQTRNLARLRIWRQVSQLAPRTLVETIIVVAGVGILTFFYSDTAEPSTVLGALGVTGLAAMRVIPSVNRMLGLIVELHHFEAPLEGLRAELSRNRFIERSEETSGRPIPPLPFARDIRLENIAFRYDDGRAPALIDLSLAIRKGETVGVVGASGAGKSTLVDLLLGLLNPDQGRLLVDGADAFAAIRAWRANIGYVPQSIYLLDDTIRSNVAFGVPDAETDPARLARVLALAQLDSFVAGLPEGLETRVGEGGARLSGGQRQRIGIARALYRDPPILLFDEATSALDGETEREIVAAIDSLKGARTLIIVAHRLSTLAGCDRIVMLAGGRVVDDGPFAAMAERHPELKHAREATAADR